jgi:3-oxoacyl-[acyl-carrier-protein] synthase II
MTGAAGNDGTLWLHAWHVIVPGDDESALMPAAGDAEMPEFRHVQAVPESGLPPMLGRKGLLNKGPAIRFALAAAQQALGLPAGPGSREIDPDTGVVGCGAFTNVDAVDRIIQVAVAEGPRRVSVLDAPNASGNVLASSVAIRFGLGGPNVMVASGLRAGEDALRVARAMLRAGRATKVLVVSVEHAGPAVRSLVRLGDGPPLVSAATALLLSAVPPEPPRSRIEVTVGTRMCAARELNWPSAYGGGLPLALAIGAEVVQAGLAPAVRIRAGQGNGITLVRNLDPAPEGGPNG